LGKNFGGKMKKLVLFPFLVMLTISIASNSSAQSYPGSFTRVGFGAKGMALGNSISATTTGNVYPFYNPALATFQTGGSAAASVSLMSLGRQINIFSYTQGVKPTAGLAAGIMNATVSNIDGRDADGQHTTDLSTSENLFFFSFGNRFADNFSLGLSLKVYYYKLYSSMSSTSVGFDFGGIYEPTNNLSLGLAITDVGESYHWDSSALYGTSGSNFKTDFPHIIRVGLSYNLPIYNISASAQYDIAPSPLSALRIGIEYAPFNLLDLRGGFSAFNEQLLGTKVYFSFGFGAKISFLDFTPEVNYAYNSEPFSPYGIQTVTIIFGF
jgi:hypothetical protein